MSAPGIDSRALAEKVRERIQSALVDLLPDEEWRRLVEAEVRSFLTTPPVEPWHHGAPPRRHASRLQDVVRGILEEETARRCREHLTGLACWSPDQFHAAVVKIAEEAAPAMIKTWLVGVLQNFVNRSL